MRNRGIAKIYLFPALFIGLVLVIVAIRIIAQQSGPGNKTTPEVESATQPSGPGSTSPRQAPNANPYQ
ncbi:MAG TPA: hypothetical protein VGB55_03655 [Tepidisphaeraceae bacterium]|jgi:hypothetical protein